MLDEKLFGHKKVNLGGVSFVIRKLTPSLFLDREHMYPMSPYFESVKSTGKPPKGFDFEKKLKEQKERIREVILKAVVEVRYWFQVKKIEDLIDGIMEREFLYAALLTVITEHTFGLKKNRFRLFQSVESLRTLFTR